MRRVCPVVLHILLDRSGIDGCDGVAVATDRAAMVSTTQAIDDLDAVAFSRNAWPERRLVRPHLADTLVARHDGTVIGLVFDAEVGEPQLGQQRNTAGIRKWERLNITVRSNEKFMLRKKDTLGKLNN